MRVAFVNEDGVTDVRNDVAYVTPQGDHLAFISTGENGEDNDPDVERNATLLNVEREL